MSSDDSGFDKEAEREKLREKYEQDQKDRENTRRMSELLLQGATMTGKHCDRCGDPIFRYDGQEFCPTCQHEADAQAQAQQQNGEGVDQSGQPAESAGRSAEASGQSAEDAAQAQAGPDPDLSADDDAVPAEATGDSQPSEQAGDADDQPRVEIEGVRVGDRHVDRSDVRSPPSQSGDDRRGEPARGRRESVRDRPADDRRGRGSRRSARDRGAGTEAGRDHVHGHSAASPDAAASGGGDLATARESLVRKLSALARQAEQTDDVARARDLLAATREAAEALAALDRADR
ncbi:MULTISPECIES: Sjogren's syndrome/scleroderma autoantigen 1 family protein [Halorussus]|uniref:Sjogren's syndrome/scleroderma autoantigen 1 family protein n=1 Tax=Halorussus TaxID=1070314 RepID=UPI000E21A0AE|nr:MULTISPECIES: Sjogren's syndrome/scleroderma autoantigen 1 family protein [Halorussus]NHN60677.1 hypothetical protein [Halorussus sp. JP-T4]